jgi:hypothetical protein
MTIHHAYDARAASCASMLTFRLPSAFIATADQRPFSTGQVSSACRCRLCEPARCSAWPAAPSAHPAQPPVVDAGRDGFDVSQLLVLDVCAVAVDILRARDRDEEAPVSGHATSLSWLLMLSRLRVAD